MSPITKQKPTSEPLPSSRNTVSIKNSRGLQCWLRQLHVYPIRMVHTSIVHFPYLIRKQNKTKYLTHRSYAPLNIVLFLKFYLLAYFNTVSRNIEIFRASRDLPLIFFPLEHYILLSLFSKKGLLFGSLYYQVGTECLPSVRQE